MAAVREEKQEERPLSNTRIQASAGSGDFYLVEEGVYRAQVNRLLEGPTGQYGPSIIIVFNILDDPDAEGEEVRQLVSAKISVAPDKESNLYKTYKALTGDVIDPEDELPEIDLKAMIGQIGQITIEHKSNKKGQVFANVTAVSPDRQSRKARSQQRPAPARQPQPESEDEEDAPAPSPARQAPARQARQAPAATRRRTQAEDDESDPWDE
jgi:hypothetical protein